MPTTTHNINAFIAPPPAPPSSLNQQKQTQMLARSPKVRESRGALLFCGEVAQKTPFGETATTFGVRTVVPFALKRSLTSGLECCGFVLLLLP